MKNLLNILFTFLIVGCAVRSSFDTVTIETPTTQCGMCKKTIESNLSSVDGVNSVTVDIINYQTVIQYNPNRVSLADIELAIAKSGYQANGKKADSTVYGNLPKCCRLTKDRN